MTYWLPWTYFLSKRKWEKNALKIDFNLSLGRYLHGFGQTINWPTGWTTGHTYIRTADRQIRILPSGYYTWPEEGKANLYLYDSYSYWWMWVLIPLPVFFFMPTRPKKSQMSEEGYSKARNRIYMSGHSFFQRGLLMLIPEESSSPATIGDICDQPRPRITSFTRS